jgi:phosphoglycolate phosphatase
MTHKSTLIFDLDGTLIDSAPSILASFAMVLEEAGVTANVPLANNLIGPPIQETLTILTGIDDPHIINTYVESFKRHYDSNGYKATKVYSGVSELLAALHADGFTLHLATNKRLAPTRLILDYLGWSSYFQSVYALDLYTPRLPDKGALLECLLTEQGLQSSEVLYIGDKTEDAQSAEQNGMAFLGVAWGYGDFDSACKWPVLNSPAFLLQQVRND